MPGTAIWTSLIVRLASPNRMVTKGYRKGVYEWVVGRYAFASELQKKPSL